MPWEWYIYLHDWLIFNVGKYTVRPMDPMGMVNDGWDEWWSFLKVICYRHVVLKTFENTWLSGIVDSFIVGQYGLYWAKRMTNIFHGDVFVFYTLPPDCSWLGIPKCSCFVAGNQFLIYFGSKGCTWHCQFHSFLLVRKNPRVRSGECISMTQVSRFKYPYHRCMVYLPDFACIWLFLMVKYGKCR